MRLHAGFVVAAVLVSPIPASIAHAAPPIVLESRCASGSAYIEGGTGWANSNAKSNRSSCAVGSRSTKDAAAYADFIPPIVTEATADCGLDAAVPGCGAAPCSPTRRASSFASSGRTSSTA